MLHDPSHAPEPISAEEIEIIIKDISTVRYRPQRLWEWAQIAMEEVTR